MAHEPEQAAQLIRELDSLTGNTRSAGRSVATGVPLIGWGIAWMVGYVALDLFTGPLRIAIVCLVWAVGMLSSWLPSRHAIRTGLERRIRTAWAAVLIGSPFLVAAAAPDSLTTGALFLGGLWSLAMCLYALATDDVPYAVTAMVGVMMAGVANVQPWTSPLIWYGLTAGLPLLIMGLRRILPGGHRD